MKFKKANEEVLIAKNDILFLKRNDLRFLKSRARKNKRRRIRICAHKTVKEKLQEMFIVMSRGCYVRPHKHINKTESLHIIEGKADVIFFNNQGRVTKVVPVGDYKSGKAMYYRLAQALYHTLLIRSPHLVIHETTTGPFIRRKTILAPWAPEDFDKTNVRLFMSKLERDIRK